MAGALVATILLAVAVRRRTLEGAVYGYVALVVEALLAIVTFVSGNFAPPALDHVAGISRDQITFHQITGLAAMIVSVLVGLLAAIPLVLTNIATRRGVLIAYLISRSSSTRRSRLRRLPAGRSGTRNYCTKSAVPGS